VSDANERLLKRERDEIERSLRNAVATKRKGSDT
jgi:hypothetical protein